MPIPNSNIMTVSALLLIVFGFGNVSAVGVNGTSISANGIGTIGNNNSTWGNVTAMRNATSGTMNFYDLTLPLSIAVLLAMLEIIGIALSFASGDEWIVIFSLVGANFSGLILTLGFKTPDVGFLFVSLLAAGYYVMKNAHKWWH